MNARVRLSRLAVAVLRADAPADRVVPPTGFTARLTLFVAGAMAFLAVFALALSLAAGRLAERWSDGLAQAVTVRISAPAGEAAAQAQAALRVLEQTPGVADAKILEAAAQRALLAPWLGADLPLEELPLPVLIDVAVQTGFDGPGLQARLSGEVPGAVLDDHGRWRAPLVVAAERLRSLGAVSVLLIGAALAAMISLAAQAALAANAQVIETLRLVGATDIYIARAFVRRFTQRAATGAAAGTVLGLGAVALLPGAEPLEGGVLTGLGFAGAQWLGPLALVPLSALVAYFATRAAALRSLGGLQ